MQNVAFELYVSVRQLGTRDAMTRCRTILMLFFFFACPVEPTLCGAAHSKYCGKDNINVEMLFLKTETKPFTQNAYLLHFLEGHLSPLHSLLTQESPKTCQINVSSTFEKTCNYWIKKLAF